MRVIRNYLLEHPNAIRSDKRELAEFEKARESAKEHGVQFHAYIDA